MKQQVSDDRGWITKTRRRLPSGLSRALRAISLGFFRLLPSGLKYSVAGALQSRRTPYRLLAKGDRVVQVGAPRDLLLGGRSRAVHFARMVGATGRVLVVEPDPKSAAALESFLAKHRLNDRVAVVNLGAWKERGTLEFRMNPAHPASNRVAMLESGEEPVPADEATPGWEIATIEVDRLGSILQEHNFENPKLISITTNGAEREILAGLWAAGDRFVPRFVSLGPPNEENVPIMAEHGFRWIAWDDRGQLFEREA